MEACLLSPQRDISEHAGKDGVQVRICTASFDTASKHGMHAPGTSGETGVPQDMAERVEISRCIDAAYTGAVNKGLVSHRSVKRESSGASLWPC